MPEPRTVATIGVFDGVHVGHAAILARARSIADAGGGGGRVAALAFDPHPLATLAPERAPTRLTTFKRRVGLLREAGADDVQRLAPTPALLSLSPQIFVERLVKEQRPAAIVEGADFRFGKGRAGDAEALRTIGARLGVAVEIVEPVEIDLDDQTVARASSTLIRWLLSAGRVRDARRALGRLYELEGVVVEGDKRGRTLGFPTANIQPEALVPADGVYAGLATDAQARWRLAAISVGTKPTFSGDARAVEAHLLDWDGPLDSYGWRTRVRFAAHLRDQARYASVDALTAQIERDCTRVRAVAAQEQALERALGGEAAVAESICAGSGS